MSNPLCQSGWVGLRENMTWCVFQLTSMEKRCWKPLLRYSSHELWVALKQPPAFFLTLLQHLWKRYKGQGTGEKKAARWGGGMPAPAPVGQAVQRGRGASGNGQRARLPKSRRVANEGDVSERKTACVHACVQACLCVKLLWTRTF